jgi:acyl-ACP thioesterase
MKYEGTFIVRADEVTPDKMMSVPAMIRLMQEGSMQNSLEHKFSVWDMEADGISWVLLRKKLIIYKYPKLSEKVKVVTYPITTERILANRDYKLYDNSNRLLATASSTWTIINLKSRKLERIPQKFKNMVAPEGEEILDPPSSKFQRPDEYDYSSEFSPQFFDTDWNDHVNNIYFIKSMIESTPRHILKSMKIKELTYHIRSESLLGDCLVVRGVGIDEKTHLFEIKNKSSNKAISYGEIKWI